MVYRVYVEKKKGLEHEANSLYHEITEMLGISSLEKVRLFNRYDVENIEKELFDYSVNTVFSEPQLDNVSYLTPSDDCTVFAIEYLPGQFDQRADSAAQCIQLISQKDRPIVRTAKVYCLYGKLTDDELAAIKKYVINPVESREATLGEFTTLVAEYEIPTSVDTINGFIGYGEEELANMVSTLGLAMDIDDIRFCRD